MSASQYRKYKIFNESSFLNELDQEVLKEDMYKNNGDLFSTFTETFRRVLGKHAPLKTKRVRGNQSPFMTKDLSGNEQIKNLKQTYKIAL